MDSGGIREATLIPSPAKLPACTCPPLRALGSRRLGEEELLQSWPRRALEPSPLLEWDKNGGTTVPTPADVSGHLCPRFAHVRKVNPRDLPTDQGGAFHQTLTFQVLRRGITWGDPFPREEGVADPADGQRGLLFLCYQTSIRRQFEVLNVDRRTTRVRPFPLALPD